MVKQTTVGIGQQNDIGVAIPRSKFSLLILISIDIGQKGKQRSLAIPTRFLRLSIALNPMNPKQILTVKS